MSCQKPPARPDPYSMNLTIPESLLRAVHTHADERTGLLAVAIVRDIVGQAEAMVRTVTAIGGTGSDSLRDYGDRMAVLGDRAVVLLTGSAASVDALGALSYRNESVLLMLVREVIRDAPASLAIDMLRAAADGAPAEAVGWWRESLRTGREQEADMAALNQSFVDGTYKPEDEDL